MIQPTPSDALRTFRQQQAQRFAEGECATLLGNSPAMARLRAQLEAAAASGASVLIQGSDAISLSEVAQAIHFRRHPQGDAQLWSVDVQAALPSELSRTLDAMLRDEQQGTLLLEAAYHLPAEQQLQLLTAVAQPQCTAQLIATHPRPPEGDQPNEMGLSDELVAVLSTIVITLPPLADRPEDIPTLVDFLLAQLDREAEGGTSNIADEALDVMMVYGWPGEIQELAEVVSQAHARARGRTIGSSHLPQRLAHAVDKAALAADKPEPIALDDYLSRVESALVERALELARGNKAEAARLLGVSRPRLYRKMEQMELMHSTPSPKPPAATSDAQPEVESPTPETDATEDGIEFLPVDGDE